MATLTKGKIIKYAVLPEITPRILRLFSSGRGYIASWLFEVFLIVGLFDRNHVYAQARNTGKFGILNILSQAYSNIKWDFKYIDRIIIFFSIIGAMAMMVLQIILFILSLLILPSMADPPKNWSIFETERPEQDIAFMTMDLVFGIEGFFNSCVMSESETCLYNDGSTVDEGFSQGGATPFQKALHAMFEFYSYGIFIVSVLVIIYLFTTVLAETASDGIPFGRRFNRLWAPIRFMFFILLLAPVSVVSTGTGGDNKLSIAQMSVFYAAKAGSGLATNSWLAFNSLLTTSSILGGSGSNEDVWIAKPSSPDVAGLLQFMSVVHTCTHSQKLVYNRDVKAYLVKSDGEAGIEAPESYVIVPENYLKDGDLVIRFGEQDGGVFGKFKGYVKPFCGEINIPNFYAGGAETAGSIIDTLPGIASMFHYNIVIDMWLNPTLKHWGQDVANVMIKHGDPAGMPKSENLMEQYKHYQTTWVRNMANSITALVRSSLEATVPQSILNRGWAGAGIFYNKIAEMNGVLSDSVRNIPTPKLWTDGIEQILKERQEEGFSLSGNDILSPDLPDGKPVEFKQRRDREIAMAERKMYNIWQTNHVPTRFSDTGDIIQQDTKTGNLIIDTINAILGTHGLFDMKNNTETHPLAQLAQAGKTIVNQSIVMFGITALSGITTFLPNKIFSGIAGELAGVAGSIAMIGFAVGLILFYVIPFMPFVYFMFAFLSWIRAIFEALIGTPLWAFAHLTIDEDGLPGKAMGGYLLLLEIALRPVLIVAGLISGILISHVGVSVMNEIFALAVDNAFDQNPDDVSLFRDAIDTFFFTIVYVIIAYMICLSCFKLVDLVPDNIMRWIGDQVSAYGDTQHEDAGNLISRAHLGADNASSELAGSGKSLLQTNFELGG